MNDMKRSLSGGGKILHIRCRLLCITHDDDVEFRIFQAKGFSESIYISVYICVYVCVCVGEKKFV